MTLDLATLDLMARVGELLGDELLAVEDVYERELASSTPCVADVYRHVSRFRGKRLRPILVLLAGRACGRLTDEHVVLAAVVEMIHTATLVHDDVLDEAATRRHVATVNTRWNNETSVLFGDYLFTHAFHLAASLSSTHACRLIGRATNIVCEGELSQIHERGNVELSEADYLRIIDGKTAELCAVSCRLGAHYAGADEETAASLEACGRAMGVAFQIADDLLDVLGSENEAGKSLGTDLEKQKLTLPLIRLRDRSVEPERARICELLERPNGDGREELLAALDRSDALEYTQVRAVEYAEAAADALCDVASGPEKNLLIEMAEFASRRSF